MQCLEQWDCPFLGTQTLSLTRETEAAECTQDVEGGNPEPGPTVTVDSH
jgi:hypothetical protein